MAPHRTPLKKHVENARELLEKNKTHHGRATNYLHERGHPLKKSRVIALRQGHLTELAKMPFFHRLLERREEITAEHEGRKETYTLLLNGLQIGKSQSRGVVMLDPKMRGVLFFRATSKKLGIFWTPIKNVVRKEVEGVQTWVYLPLGTKPSEYPFYEKLSQEIEKREKHIDFSKTYREDRVAQIRQYL